MTRLALLALSTGIWVGGIAAVLTLGPVLVTALTLGAAASLAALAVGAKARA